MPGLEDTFVMPSLDLSSSADVLQLSLGFHSRAQDRITRESRASLSC